MDLVGAVRSRSQETAEMRSDDHGESGFFPYFPEYRRMVGLPGLDPATRKGPQSLARLVRPQDQQQSSLRIMNHGSDAADHGPFRYDHQYAG